MQQLYAGQSWYAEPPDARAEESRRSADRLLERLIDKATIRIVVVGAVDPAARCEFPRLEGVRSRSAGTAIIVNGEALAPGDRVLTTTPNGTGFRPESSPRPT